MTNAIADPVFLYNMESAGEWVDSRPCFNADGSEVVFMRQNPTSAQDNNPPAALYTVSSVESTGNTPVQLYPYGSAEPDNTNQATRPDWSWCNHNIAFSGTVTPVGGSPQTGLFVLPPDGAAPVYVEITGKTSSISYPTWYPDGEHIAVTDYSVNQILEVSSGNIHSSQDGIALTRTNQIWAGMSSINQADSSQLCMAAQPPDIDNVGESSDLQPGYNQQDNNIWVQTATTDNPFSIQVPGHGNGRAPWWSPDGNFIVFESDYLHADGKSLAIFVYRITDQSITAVTPLSGWSCSHAKWHPTNSTQLVCSAIKYHDKSPVQTGIAIVTVPESVVSQPAWACNNS